MILERSMHPEYLSNTYLVAAATGGEAFFVDAGGPMEPLFEKVAEHDLTPTHVLLTHYHFDHVEQVPKILERWPEAQVLIHPLERAEVDTATGTMDANETLEVGGLEVTTVPIPGHTAGMLGLLVEGNFFTGDTLFKNSVGGVRGPGATSYADLKSSIMDTIMGLPPETVLRCGHTDASTVAEEYETNSFIRMWRGLDPEGTDDCTALGEPATLILLGDDYDGGHKAWVRWPDGRDDIVAGSKVQLAG